MLLIGGAMIALSRRHEPTPLRPADIITAEEITSPEGLHRFLENDFAVLHIDVDWSIYTAFSNPLILRLRQEIEEDSRYRRVVFRRIDLTDQDHSPLWEQLNFWLEIQGEGLLHNLPTSGYGAVIWIRNGNPVDSVVYPAHEGYEKMIAKTHSAFRE